MSFRTILSIVTLVLIALIIFFTRHEIVEAWKLLGSVNLWILALVLPLQVAAYFAAGEMMFSYLRRKGATRKIPAYRQAAMALEMNFVNHTLPSAGVSGISYMTWRLGHFDVTAGRATAAQIVRFVAGFGAFIMLLLLSLGVITLDGSINRTTLFISGMIVLTMIFGTTFLVYMIGSESRIKTYVWSFTRRFNRLVRKVTFSKIQTAIHPSVVERFFLEMHDEYLILLRDRKILLRPLLWGIVFTILEVLVFFVVFLSLGTFVSPAPILISYGLASIAGFIVITPGGAGAYEAIMVSFLASAGVPADVAIAGIVLARVIILLTTIGLGYVFYQHAIVSHGRKKPQM